MPSTNLRRALLLAGFAALAVVAGCAAGSPPTPTVAPTRDRIADIPSWNPADPAIAPLIGTA
jgi:hypothetical protein